MPVNERLLRLEVARQAQRVLVREVRPLVQLDFETKKEQFLRAFDQHDVTKELEGSPSAFSRQTAVAAAGGNLFSLLGFWNSQSPAQALRKYLDKSITLGPTRAGVVRGGRVRFSTTVKFPTVAEVDEAMSTDPEAKLDWTDRSFTQLLAKGIPGLPYFLFDQSKFDGYPPSRSGPAIQANNDSSPKVRPLRGGSTPSIPYVGQLLGVLKGLLATRR